MHAHIYLLFVLIASELKAELLRDAGQLIQRPARPRLAAHVALDIDQRKQMTEGPSDEIPLTLKIPVATGKLADACGNIAGKTGFFGNNENHAVTSLS